MQAVQPGQLKEWKLFKFTLSEDTTLVTGQSRKAQKSGTSKLNIRVRGEGQERIFWNKQKWSLCYHAGKVPEELEYTTISSGRTKKRHSSLVAAAVIELHMKTAIPAPVFSIFVHVKVLNLADERRCSQHSQKIFIAMCALTFVSGTVNFKTLPAQGVMKCFLGYKLSHFQFIVKRQAFSGHSLNHHYQNN